VSLQQLQGIFSGALSDWSQVGGKPGKINVYARDSKSGTFDTFKTLVLDPGKQKVTGSAQGFESSEELSDSVTNDPSGIGFVGFAYLRNAKAISLVNECGMSFKPTTFNVKTEEYPLSRRPFVQRANLEIATHVINGCWLATLRLARSPSCISVVRIANEPASKPKRRFCCALRSVLTSILLQDACDARQCTESHRGIAARMTDDPLLATMSARLGAILERLD
jgi:hypothetical protein